MSGRLRIFLFLIIFLLNSELIAQISYDKISNWLDNSAFQSGEYLKYEVSYGLIKGGEAELRVELDNSGGDWYYHCTAKAHTAGIAAKLFTIRDTYESYINIENGLPVKAIRNIREQAYTYYNEILFRRSDSTLYSLRSGKKKISPKAMDIVAAFYFARRYLFNQGLNKGDTILLLTYFDDKLYDINIRFYKKEKIHTKFGRISVLKFRPIIDNKLFTDENEMEIWFTNDQNFVPIKIQVDLPISKINCRLIKYSGLKNPNNVL